MLLIPEQNFTEWIMDLASKFSKAGELVPDILAGTPLATMAYSKLSEQRW